MCMIHSHSTGQRRGASNYIYRRDFTYIEGILNTNSICFNSEKRMFKIWVNTAPLSFSVTDSVGERLKVMHYYIALLPKKVSKWVTLLLFIERNAWLLFLIWAWLACYIKSSNKPLSDAAVLDCTLLFVLIIIIIIIIMVELVHQRSAEKTLINNMGLNKWRLFVPFNIIIAGLHHILSLYLTVFIDFEEYWICFCAGE